MLSRVQVMADLENGLWAGSQKVAPAPSINFTWVTAMAKGQHSKFALKGGNAREGTLQTLHDGPRPLGYEIMKKQGSIILGEAERDVCTCLHVVASLTFRATCLDALLLLQALAVTIVAEQLAHSMQVSSHNLRKCPHMLIPIESKPPTWV